jgi:hypothetical protein
VGGRALQTVEQQSRRSGLALQNASYQVQDFFVQVAAGTDPMRALSQQLPQLLGPLGLMGAVAGTAVAGLSVLWTVMGTGEASASDLTESLNDLSAAADEYLSSVRAANTGTDELAEKYGRASVLAREFLSVQREMDGVRAQDVIDTTINSAINTFTRRGFQRYDDDIYSRIDDLENASYDLENALGLTEVQANELAKALETVALAEGPRAQADAAYAVLVALEDSIGFYSVMDSEARKLYDTMFDIAREADNVAVTNELAAESMDLFGNAASNAIAWVSELVGETDSLAARAADAAANMWDFLGAQGAAQRAYNTSVGGGRGLGPQGPDLDPYGFRDQIERQNRQREQDSRRQSGGARRSGGGGSRAQNDALREAERLFDATRTEGEKYAAELADIDRLLAQGLITQDTYNRGVADLSEKYLEAGDAATFWKDTNDQIKDSFLDLATTGEASFDRITQSISRALLEAALFNDGPLSDLFSGAAGGGASGGRGGGGGSLLSGIGEILGDFFGGSFEGGGFTGAGPRTGGLDGRGGFMAMVHPNETVIDHTRGPRSTGGGGVTIIDQRSGGAPISTEQRMGPDGRQQVVAIVRDETARGGLDSVNRARFGSTTQRRKV